MHGDYPCLDESKLLCPDAIDPDDIFQCLSGYVNSNHKKLSKSCQVIVSGYQTCLAEGLNGPSDAPPNDPLDGDSPPSGENGNDQNGNTKPAPKEKQPPQSQRKLQKDKPAPKPKPGPGNEKPCWAKGAPDDVSSGENGAELHDENDLLSHQSASHTSSSDSTSMTSIGMTLA